MWNNIDHGFGKWAFGDTWAAFLCLDRDCVDLVNAWNEMHGQKHQLKTSDGIWDSMVIMHRLWDEEGSPGQTGIAGLPKAKPTKLRVFLRKIVQRFKKEKKA